MYKIYGDLYSGNCYKIKLLTTLLDIEHEWIPVDIMAGETHTDEFILKNPVGKIPLLELDDGQYLSESNAILNYLAEGSHYLPADRLQRARVLQWQFFEQYSHEPYIATSRYIIKYLGAPEEKQEELAAKKAGGIKALGVMETQLAQTPFLAGQKYTIADISLYAYTHVAHEGGFALDDFPHIQAWMERMEAHPDHITMAQAIAG